MRRSVEMMTFLLFVYGGGAFLAGMFGGGHDRGLAIGFGIPACAALIWLGWLASRLLGYFDRHPAERDQ